MVTILGRGWRIDGVLKGGGDEVDKFLDTAKELRLQVRVAGHPAEDAAPCRGDVGGGGGRPADTAQHSFLPRLAPRHVRPGLDADRGGFDRGPDVDERVTGDQHVVRPGRDRDPGLLGAVDEMVDKDAEPAVRAGAELLHDRRQVVDAFQVLHDDTDVTQVITPDLLDQFGVVLALDIDPAGLRDLRGRHRRGDGAGRGPPGARRLRPGPDQFHAPPLEEEGTRQREGTALAAGVLQGDRILLEGDDRAAEPALEVLHDQSGPGLDLRHGSLPGPRLVKLRRQDIFPI